MKSQDNLFGFVRIDLKWYYIGKVSGLKDCFWELDKMYSKWQKTGDSFFWIEEAGELHNPDGDEKVGYGYLNGFEVVTAKQFADGIGRIIFRHEGIAALRSCDLDVDDFDMIDLADWDEDTLYQFAMTIYQSSRKFTVQQLYHISIGVGEWANNTVGMIGSYHSADEIRSEIEEFIEEDSDYYKEVSGGN